MSVSADDWWIPTATSLYQPCSGAGATGWRKMNVQTLWGSDEILYKLHMVWIEQIILNYGTTQLRRQFAIDSKAVLYSHGSNGGSEAASAGVNFYTIKLIKRASLDLGVTFASKRGLRT